MYKPTKLLNRYFVLAWFIGLTLCIGQNVFNSTVTPFANANGYSNTFAGSLSVGYLFGTLSHIILIYTQNDLLFAFAGFFYGANIAALPVMQNAAVRHLPPDKKGAGTATLNMAVDLTMGILPLLWGILIDRIGYAVPFLIGAGMYLAALAVHVVVQKREKTVCQAQ